MRALLILLCLALLGTACTRKLTPGPTTTTDRTTERTTTRKDSSSTRVSDTEKVRLSKVQVGADKVPFTTQLEVNAATGKFKPATYTSRGRRATVQLTVDEAGKVTGECGCDAEQAIIASKDRIIERQQQLSQQLLTDLKQQEVRVETVPMPVPYTAWYDVLARIMASLLVVGLLMLLWMYFKARGQAPQPEQDDGTTI